jgi:dihydroorotate dehydrogenase electron transfer subunit
MAYHEPVILEKHTLGALCLLRLHAPDLARAARAGQAIMLRCAPPGSADPLLRRALFLAGADSSAGTLDLLFDPAERGLAWLAAQAPDAQLDSYGPLGNGFSLDQRTRNLLLAGTGAALPALLFLARHAITRNLAVVLLAAAATPALLPPAYLLPPAVEYQTAADSDGLLSLLAPTARSPLPALSGSPIAWADQVCLALDSELVASTAAAVRAARLRWERGFALVALAGPMPCGFGACLSCPVETRDGPRLRCKDGPVFDLRELRL